MGNPYPQAQPVRWLWLYLAALIAALSHILLDWTNNYGVRPFFPFNPRWYAGSFFFIAEPVLWVLLIAALVIPGLLGLADREIGARRVAFRGRAWAIFALCGFFVLGCWRWAEHAQAAVMLQNTQVASAPVTRIAIEPYPVNPFHWHAILETDSFYQTAEINTNTGSIDSDPAARRALQARRYACRRSRQAHLPRPGLSRLGNMGRRPRPGPGACARHGPAPAAAQSAPGPPSSSPTCVLTTPFAARAGPPVHRR